MTAFPGLPLVVCGLIGLVNGLLIARTNMAPFIVTLASLLFARGLPSAESLLTYQPPLPTNVRDIEGAPVQTFARERREQLRLLLLRRNTKILQKAAMTKTVPEFRPRGS